MQFDNFLPPSLEQRIRSGHLLILESILDSTEESTKYYLLLDELKQSYRTDVHSIAFVGEMTIYSNLSSTPSVKWHDEPVSITFTVCHSSSESLRTVSLGPSGELFMLPKHVKGKGLGRFAASRLIDKIAYLGEEYKVSEGKLSNVDTKTDTDRERRNQFYRGMGLTLEFDNSQEETDGRFYAGSVKELVTRYPDDKLRLVGGDEAITKHLDMIKERNKLNDDAFSYKTGKDDLEKINKTNYCLWAASLAGAFIAGLFF